MTDSFELFTTCVTRAYKSIQQIKKQESLTFGIMGFQVMCVFFLGKNPEGLTITEMAALCCEDKAAVSRTVESLVLMGYARYQETEPKKRWRAKVRLTDRGREIARGINRLTKDIVAHVGEGFDETQIVNFYKMFFIFNDRLSKYCAGMKQGRKKKEGRLVDFT